MDINPVLSQRPPIIEKRMIAVRTKNQIVALSTSGEIFTRVIDDVVCANRSCGVHISCAAHGRNFRPERFGNLHRECTYTTRRAVNQNFLALLDSSFVTESLEGSKSRHGQSCCVLERYVGWLQR